MVVFHLAEGVRAVSVVVVVRAGGQGNSLEVLGASSRISRQLFAALPVLTPSQQ